MSEYVFSTDTLEYEVKGKGTNRDYYVEGYISTPDLDQGNDIVTDSCLDDMVSQLKERNIKIDIEHESWTDPEKRAIQIGRIIGVKRDEKGVKVRVILNKHHNSLT